MCLTLCLALAMTGLVSTSSAQAQEPNCTKYGPAGNYFDGMQHNGGSTYFGVGAKLLVKHASVCDTDTSPFNPTTKNLGNFTWAWTLIGDWGGYGWIQSGYFRSYNTGIMNFAQYYSGTLNSLHDNWGGSLNPGNIRHYWQQRAVNGRYHSNVNHTQYLTTPVHFTSSWLGFTYQYHNETRYLSSDVPGTSTSRMSFSALQVENSSNNWVSIPSPFLSGVNDSAGSGNGGRWGGPHPTSTTSFTIWTM